MLAMQRPDGHLEDWYGEGNFNRTLLLWALMKSQGVMPAEKAPALRLGAVREGDALRLFVGGVSSRSGCSSTSRATGASSTWPATTSGSTSFPSGSSSSRTGCIGSAAARRRRASGSARS